MASNTHNDYLFSFILVGNLHECLIFYNSVLLAVPQYKNRLQEYTQKEGLPLPLYQTIFDGTLHSPMFKSTVVVNGVSYTSPKLFPNRKAAEMDAARIALLSVPQLETNCSINQEVIAYEFTYLYSISIFLLIFNDFDADCFIKSLLLFLLIDLIE